MNDPKKTPSRIYIIIDKTDGKAFYCRATNPSQAVSRVTRERFYVRVASQDDLVGVAREAILEAKP